MRQNPSTLRRDGGTRFARAGLTHPRQAERERSRKKEDRRREFQCPNPPEHVPPVPVRRVFCSERGTGFLLANRNRTDAARIQADLGAHTGRHRNPPSAHPSRTPRRKSQDLSDNRVPRVRCTKADQVPWAGQNAFGSSEDSICAESGSHLDITTGALAVPARSMSLSRGDLEHFWAFPPAMLLRTGTVLGPSVADSRCAPRNWAIIKIVAKVGGSVYLKASKPDSFQNMDYER